MGGEGGQDSIRRVRAPVKVLLESPEFFRTLGPETNGIFPSCFQTFSLSLALPYSLPTEEERRRKGRSVRVVTRYPLLTNVGSFPRMRRFRSTRNPPFYRAVKSLVIPRKIYGIVGNLLDCGFFPVFFFFFRSEGGINIFRKLKRNEKREDWELI